MQIVVLNAAEVRALLPMAECIGLMRTTMIAVAEGRAAIPLRLGVRMPGDRGMMGVMPGYLGEPDCYGVKIISLTPRNVGTEFSSHLGVVLLFETDHGRPVAFLDAGEITAIRTAAASGLATDLLARPDAGDLAILGAGEQARSHLAAMLAVRPVRRVRIWSRRVEAAQAFAAAEGERHGIAVEACSTVADTVGDADLICAVSKAAEPILFSADVADGAHINLVGSSIASAAEADTPLVARARYFVDLRLSAVNEAGEYLRALVAGAITPAHILGEIGEVGNGSVPGRTSPGEVTVYKSLGIAAQDLAAAHFLTARAREQGVGQRVEF